MQKWNIKNKDKNMHYYKMWVQFTSLHSLDEWIHSKSNEITWHIGTLLL
jgi:antibiotic biosynthesis monooxygenase (ABM) superfamily enzyme